MNDYPITIRGELPDVADVARLLRAVDSAPMPKAADRDAWRQIAARPWIEPMVPGLLDRAQGLADAGPGQVRATDYLAFHRTGERDAYEGVAGRRPTALQLLTAAECVEHEGRFLDALLDLSWAMAEETSWIMPPHLRHAGEDMLPDVADPPIDLRVAGVAAVLAEMVYLLGAEMDAVSPNWRKRVNHEIRRQAIEPYLRETHFWEKLNFNWNVVCTSCVVTAALLGDFDTETKAHVLAKALASTGPFLSGLTPDGGCTEGPGYWRYAMSNHARMAYYVRCATGGAVDLLADPIMPTAFAYASKMLLSGRKVINFADCDPEISFRSGPIAWAASEVGADATAALAARGDGLHPRYGGALDLCLLPEPSSFEPAPQSCLPDLMVAAVRGVGPEEEQLVLAAKGGSNGEHHNHNDVGNFIVHRRGESLICDLGRGKYVKDFHTVPARYTYLTARSGGHKVPLVNEVEQPHGEQWRARDFRMDAAGDDVTVGMDLTGAYPPEAGLVALLRRFVFHRGGAEFVELIDEVELSGAARTYSLPLYTEGTFEQEPGSVIAQGERSSLRIEFASHVLEARVEQVEHGDRDLARRYGPTLARCVLTLRGEPQRASVHLRFLPIG